MTLMTPPITFTHCSVSEPDKLNGSNAGGWDPQFGFGTLGEGVLTTTFHYGNWVPRMHIQDRMVQAGAKLYFFQTSVSALA